MARIRLSVPKNAYKGEVITLKALIQHPMESGFRRDARGEAIARNIITKFECIYNDKIIFAADFFPAISANPFLKFHTIARATGIIRFQWTDQNGKVFSEQAKIMVG